jgi:hypothetical protein
VQVSAASTQTLLSPPPRARLSARALRRAHRLRGGDHRLRARVRRPAVRRILALLTQRARAVECALQATAFPSTMTRMVHARNAAAGRPAQKWLTRVIALSAVWWCIVAMLLGTACMAVAEIGICVLQHQSSGGATATRRGSLMADGFRADTESASPPPVLIECWTAFFSVIIAGTVAVPRFRGHKRAWLQCASRPWDSCSTVRTITSRSSPSTSRCNRLAPDDPARTSHKHMCLPQIGLSCLGSKARDDEGSLTLDCKNSAAFVVLLAVTFGCQVYLRSMVTDLSTERWYRYAQCLGVPLACALFAFHVSELVPVAASPAGLEIGLLLVVVLGLALMQSQGLSPLPWRQSVSLEWAIAETDLEHVVDGAGWHPAAQTRSLLQGSLNDV